MTTTPRSWRMYKTPHGVKGDARTPTANHGCESCHGASPEHIATKGANKALPAVRFSGPHASPVAERNAVCLTCHENEARMNWQGSQHASNEVACSSCQTVHAEEGSGAGQGDPAGQMLHLPFAAAGRSFQRSHHPMREGKCLRRLPQCPWFARYQIAQGSLRQPDLLQLPCQSVDRSCGNIEPVRETAPIAMPRMGRRKRQCSSSVCRSSAPAAIAPPATPAAVGSVERGLFPVTARQCRDEQRAEQPKLPQLPFQHPWV